MSDYIVQVRKVRQDTLGNREHTGPALTYSYGSPLRPGDLVMCPAPEYGGPFIAEVVALGRGDYQGHLRDLLCRIAPDRKRK